MITIDAVKRIFNKDHYQLVGLSTDEKPTNVDVNTLFLELDTTTFYYFDGTEWQKSEGGGVSYEEIPYSDLKSAIDSGELKAGGIYRITDYVTKVNGTYDLTEDVGQPCYIHYAKSAEHPFDLIVTAIDESHLDEHAIAIQHADDTYFANSRLTAWDILYTTENDPTKYSWADPNGKGVICYMKDENSNELPYDFKNIQYLAYALTSADLINFNDLCYNASTQPNRYGSVYYLFMALQGYMQTGTYANPFPSIWNNDFSVGQTILGTIQFPTVDATYLSMFMADWYYTFDYVDNGGNHVDWSCNSKHCFGNVIKTSQDGLAVALSLPVVPQGLPNTIFEQNDLMSLRHDCTNNNLAFASMYNIFGDTCFQNELDEQSLSNSFGNSCNSNSFGNGCNSNSFGNACHSNIFGNECSANSFENNCGSNSFGNTCNFNIFGNTCGSNSVGNNCHSNSFGATCSSNSLGNSCNSNSFGNDCVFNSFGNNCVSNSFGNNYVSNSFGDRCDYNSFGNDCYYNELDINVNKCEFDVGVTNIILSNGVNGQLPVGRYTIQSGDYLNGNNKTTISITQQTTYPTYVGFNSSGVIKQWTPADLIYPPDNGSVIIT